MDESFLAGTIVRRDEMSGEKVRDVRGYSVRCYYNVVFSHISVSHI